MLISIFLQNKWKFNGVSSKSMVFIGNTNGFSMEFKLKTNGDSIENKWFFVILSGSEGLEPQIRF
jgi:hypothetical protein